MLGGLMMCVLSVEDEGQHSEQGDVDRNWHENWNNWEESWVQNEMTDGHKIELTDGHECWNSRIWDNNLDPEQDDGLSQDLEQKLGHKYKNGFRTS